MTIVDQIRQDPQQGAKRLKSEYRADSEALLVALALAALTAAGAATTLAVVRLLSRY